jgi:hypothetical protein
VFFLLQGVCPANGGTFYWGHVDVDVGRTPVHQQVIIVTLDITDAQSHQVGGSAGVFCSPHTSAVPQPRRDAGLSDFAQARGLSDEAMGSRGAEMG